MSLSKKLLSFIMILTIIISTIPYAAFDSNAAEYDISKQSIDAIKFNEPAEPNYPVIDEITTVKEGIRLSWSAVDGAASYKLYLLQDGDMIFLAETEDTIYTHTDLVNNTEYVYTLMAFDDDGEAISSFNEEGFAHKYFDAPVLSSIGSVYGGMKISWQAVEGAPGYTVYRKTKNTSWQVISEYTESLSFIDNTAESSKEYIYTVRVVDEDKTSSLSWYDSNGLSAIYYATPEISSVNTKTDGAYIYFAKVNGVSKYRVYVKLDGKWQKIATTTNNYAVYSDLQIGKDYTFTVRGLTSDAKGYLTSYNPKGYTVPFYSNPTVAKVSSAARGYNISWQCDDSAPMYRLYRKTFAGKWTAVADTAELSFNDTNADKTVPTVYTVRCLTADKDLVSSYINYDTYYAKGVAANGIFTINGQKYVFKKGKLSTGFVKVAGKMYYYNTKGVIQKDIVVGNKTDGFYYAGKDGVISYDFNGVAKNSKGYWYCIDSKVDFTYRDAIKYNKINWLVLNGKATKVQTEEDKVLFRAFNELARCTDSSMTPYQKLKAAFMYVQKFKYKNQRIPHYHGADWPIIYANDMFVDRAGNCFSYASSFAYMAKAIGYKNVYVCNSGKHGWAEINGKVYDPQACMVKKDRSYFRVDYNECKSPAYKDLIAPGYSWMRVKI